MQDLETILEAKKRTLIVLWYPDCGSILPVLIDAVQAAMATGSEELQIAMVSVSYELDAIRINLQNYFGYTRQSWVLDHQYGKYKLTKAYEFINRYCGDCFERYGRRIDDLYLFLHDRDEGILFEGLLVWNDHKRRNDLYRKEELYDLLKKSPQKGGRTENPLRIRVGGHRRGL